LGVVWSPPRSLKGGDGSANHPLRQRRWFGHLQKRTLGVAKPLL
jgi:hypothetical protein